MGVYSTNRIRFQDLTHSQRMKIFGYMRCLVVHQRRLREKVKELPDYLEEVHIHKKVWRKEQSKTPKYIRFLDYQDTLFDLELCTDESRYLRSLIRKMKTAIHKSVLHYYFINNKISEEELDCYCLLFDSSERKGI